MSLRRRTKMREYETAAPLPAGLGPAALALYRRIRRRKFPDYCPSNWVGGSFLNFQRGWKFASAPPNPSPVSNQPQRRPDTAADPSQLKRRILPQTKTRNVEIVNTWRRSGAGRRLPPSPLHQMSTARSFGITVLKLEAPDFSTGCRAVLLYR